MLRRNSLRTFAPQFHQKVYTVHHLLLILATTPLPTPTPSLRPGLNEDQVTPGLLGFLLTAFIVVLTSLLVVDMVRRVRRVRYRGQVEEARLAAAQAEAQAQTQAESERAESDGDAGSAGR